uniref:Uncharacterized protein n=1 Tax=Ananas comosus var. bracteatus TaxID=296719 RepID=A0A6V7PGV2_ANACO|nr:unnamed protein product [Ananas comosus var. bracteatus]
MNELLHSASCNYASIVSNLMANLKVATPGQPRLTLNLIGEENLRSHTETVCGTTTSAPSEVLRRLVLRWSDHRQAKTDYTLESRNNFRKRRIAIWRSFAKSRKSSGQTGQRSPQEADCKCRQAIGTRVKSQLDLGDKGLDLESGVGCVRRFRRPGANEPLSWRLCDDFAAGWLASLWILPPVD